MPDTCSYIWVIRQIPHLVHRYQKREAVIKISIIDEVLRCGSRLSLSNGRGYIGVLRQIPFFIHNDLRQKLSDQLEQPFVRHCGGHLILAGRQLDRALYHVEWQKIPHDTNSLRSRGGMDCRVGSDGCQAGSAIITQRDASFQARVEVPIA
jgi:hypothetical protein